MSTETFITKPEFASSQNVDGPYRIDKAMGQHRKTVEDWLYGLDLVSAVTREMMITAWVSTWTSSEYRNLAEIPWDPALSDFFLTTHVNEVTRFGLAFAESAAKEWSVKLNYEVLVPILCLHDVDKPLMFVSRNGQTQHSALYSEIPHGVVGAMLLKELGFPHVVVSTVGSHSPRMPFHGQNFEAFILHYADHFSCDNAMLRAGRKPLYFYLKLPERI